MPKENDREFLGLGCGECCSNGGIGSGGGWGFVGEGRSPIRASRGSSTEVTSLAGGSGSTLLKNSSV